MLLIDDTLVIALPGVLSPVEKELAKTPAGSACVREFHRQLFADSCDPLKQQIAQIIKVEVIDSRSEVWTETGRVVQMFLLARRVGAGVWSDDGCNIHS